MIYDEVTAATCPAGRATSDRRSAHHHQNDCVAPGIFLLGAHTLDLKPGTSLIKN
jgi:hypothetical protein